jgi:hypothetical protein
VRIETFPLIIGILVALVGIGILFDAWTPDATTVSQERRRRPRIERHRNGEALIGLGVLALAAAFIGRDSWSYSVLVVIIGAVFLLVGAVLNRHYVRELFVNRGPLRRREAGAGALEPGVATPDASATLAAANDRAEMQEEALHEEGDPRWNGVERRSVPRDGGRQRNRRPDVPREDRPRG